MLEGRIELGGNVSSTIITIATCLRSIAWCIFLTFFLFFFRKTKQADMEMMTKVFVNLEDVWSLSFAFDMTDLIIVNC